MMSYKKYFHLSFLINIFHTDFLTARILSLNAVSQQYIFTIRIARIISDMILTRSSVTFKILALNVSKYNFRFNIRLKKCKNLYWRQTSKRLNRD